MARRDHRADGDHALARQPHRRTRARRRRTPPPDERDQRRQHLDELLAAAPPPSPDLWASRQEWILTNWPYVVERHELDRLHRPSHGPLDPAEAPVHELLDRIALSTQRPPHAERRSLAELAEARATLDPGRHLRELTTELVTIGDRLAHLDHGHSTKASPDASCTQREGDLRARRAALRAELAAERQRISSQRSMGADGLRMLHQAEEQRTATLTYHTIDQRPTWLTRWLTELHGEDGSLTQLDDHVVVIAIAEIAQYRDRWQITSLDPTGPQPSPQSEQFKHRQRAVKAAGLTHPALPTPSIDIASHR